MATVPRSGPNSALGWIRCCLSQREWRYKEAGLESRPCGSRDQAHKTFLNAYRAAGAGDLVVLLVDSEEEVPPEEETPAGESVEAKYDRELRDASIRKEHLVKRDGWDLKKVDAERIHLMVQCMEAWVVADPEALTGYYGKDFHANKLPQRANLEEEPKSALCDKLAQATRDTSKGEYSEANNTKLWQASPLLKEIDAAKVAKRCPRFRTLVEWLGGEIAGALSRCPPSPHPYPPMPKKSCFLSRR